MKTLSLSDLAENTRDSFLRFPLAILSAFAGTLVGIYLVEVQEVSDNLFPLINLMLCAALGIPLFFAAHVFVERSKAKGNFHLGIYFLTILTLGGLYYSLPSQDMTHNTWLPYIRYAMYNACAHLVIAFIPFVPQSGTRGFWNYNVMLFIRILTSLFYSTILFIGISLALLALHLLFDIDFDEKIYLQIFITIIGLFNTLFFLAGVPEDLDKMEVINEFPKPLKVFAQYILLPLLILYLLILYGYGAKIVLTWDWPRGIVSYLVICVSVLGVTTFLLLYPYGHFEGKKWIQKGSKVFYCLLIPLLVLLFIAIIIRLQEYGVTINRYLIVVLGLWLVGTSLHFIFGKGNIKYIPMSLAAVLLLSSFGPWGVFKVSERSQVNRLKIILSQANILSGGKVHEEVIWDQDQLPELIPSQKATHGAPLSDSLYSELVSILHYLDDHHGFRSIKTWFSQDLDQVLQKTNKDKLKWQRMQEVEIYMETLGLDYRRFSGGAGEFYSFQADVKQATRVKDFDFLIDFDINESGGKEFIVNGNSHVLQLNESHDGLVLTFGGEEVLIPLAAVTDPLLPRHSENIHRSTPDLIPLSKMTIIPDGKENILVEIHQINLQRTDGEKQRVNFISGYLLLKEK
jgi:hypothetical protein